MKEGIVSSHCTHSLHDLSQGFDFPYIFYMTPNLFLILRFFLNSGPVGICI
jgi:hypothetical protein